MPGDEAIGILALGEIETETVAVAEQLGGGKILARQKQRVIYTPQFDYASEDDLLMAWFSMMQYDNIREI